MSDELDTWLFNHAQLMGNQCDGLKDETGENFAWQDTVTKEVFVMGLQELQATITEHELRLHPKIEAYQKVVIDQQTTIDKHNQEIANSVILHAKACEREFKQQATITELEDGQHWINLYSFGDSPFWTMHASKEIAEAQAQSGHPHDPLHIALRIQLPPSSTKAGED